ncbi:MAG: transposase [Bacillota bacterium]
MSGRKFTLGEKLRILAWIDEGHPVKEAVSRFNVGKSTIRRWRIRLQEYGIDSLVGQLSSNHYPAELKMQAVQAYLTGEGSQMDICLRYGIREETQLRRWIFKYTQGEELKSSPGGESRDMNKGRRTTYDERIEIVRHCIANDCNYREAAERYKVSYQQVHSWVSKYNKGGEKALVDRRGKAKEETELTEADRLKIELRNLQKEVRRLSVENAFLKKLEELEKRYR